MIYFGIVEDRNDPLKLGRCRCRVVGLHSHDKVELPTESLPWAIPIQGINSAAISGVGASPTGIVEGSTVAIMFSDPDNQSPIIMGAIAGIPQGFGDIDNEENTLAIVDEDGEVPQGSDVEYLEDSFNSPSSYSISDNGLNLIKQFESKSLEAYYDVNKYSIGYGVSTVDGIKVYKGMVITDEQAESSLREYVTEVAIPDVVKSIKAPITQGMFDALVSLAYNMGGTKFRKTTFVSLTNKERYTEAASQITTYNADANGNTLTGLVARRTEERNLYLTSYSRIINNSLSHLSTENIGFKDPKGIFPKYLYEPDTNRLARHERIETTIVRKKELSRERDVVSVGVTWSQSLVPYNTSYPYNHVYQSESGHVFEFDDTANSERIHLYHKSGTFFEVDSNGTEVKKIVGDGYEILERDGYLYIKGERNVTIDGATNVQINNVLNLDVHGKTTVNVYNSVDMNVSGSMNLSVKEAFNVKAKSFSLQANSANVEVDTMNQEYSTNNLKEGDRTETINGDSKTVYNGDRHTHIGADTYSRHDVGTNYSCPSDPPRTSDEDCSDIDEANGASVPSITTPENVKEIETVDNYPLEVTTRGSEAVANYDTPEAGDPTEYRNRLVEKGIIDPTLEDNTTTQETVVPENNNKEPVSPTCDLIYNKEDFPANYQLSKHYSLYELTKQGTRPPKAQIGLSKQDIVCNLKGLCENCLDVIFEMYPNVYLTSGFRRPGDVKGSSVKSQHNKGQAADIKFSGFTRKQHFDAIKEIQKAIPYDQIIMEYDGSGSYWTHISFKYEGNRKQHFTMKNNKTVGGGFILIS